MYDGALWGTTWGRKFGEYYEAQNKSILYQPDKVVGKAKSHAINFNETSEQLDATGSVLKSAHSSYAHAHTQNTT